MFGQIGVRRGVDQLDHEVREFGLVLGTNGWGTYVGDCAYPGLATRGSIVSIPLLTMC